MAAVLKTFFEKTIPINPSTGVALIRLLIDYPGIYLSIELHRKERTHCTGGMGGSTALRVFHTLK